MKEPDTMARALVLSPSRASVVLISGGASLSRQFAQGDGQIAGGAFEAGSAGFEFFNVVTRAHGDGGQCMFDLCVQTLGFGLGLFFGARQRSRS